MQFIKIHKMLFPSHPTKKYGDAFPLIFSVFSLVLLLSLVGLPLLYSSFSIYFHSDQSGGILGLFMAAGGFLLSFPLCFILVVYGVAAAIVSMAKYGVKPFPLLGLIANVSIGIAAARMLFIND